MHAHAHNQISRRAVQHKTEQTQPVDRNLTSEKFISSSVDTDLRGQKSKLLDCSSTEIVPMENRLQLPSSCLAALFPLVGSHMYGFLSHQTMVTHENMLQWEAKS